MLVLLPMLISIGIAILVLDAPTKPADAPSPPGSAHVDPALGAALVDGERALRQTIGDPGYVAFNNSAVIVSAGGVISLCGTLRGTSGFASPSGEERFVVLSGQSVAQLQSGDSSFNVLWARVC